MTELQCKTMEVQNLRMLFRGFAMAKGVFEPDIVKAINTAHDYAFKEYKKEEN